MLERLGRRPGAVVGLVSVAGALVAALLGILTFGARATVAPDGVPVAIAAPADGRLHQVAEQVSARAGGKLDWTVTSPQQARSQLLDKEIYGYLELTATQSGPTARVVVSGAVSPAGTRVAQTALTGVGQALTRSFARGTEPAAMSVETLHPAGTAARTAPLALSALAWVGCLVAGALLTLLCGRAGVVAGRGMRVGQITGSAVLLTGVLAGLLALWDSTLPLDWDVLGFLALTVAAFAAAQAGLFRLLGLRAMAILAPLYLIAPSVAGQVPELLHPAYRTLLWSWTPFRFSTGTLRSLLQGTPGAPDVATGIWVMAGLLVAGLVVLLWPRRRSARQEAEPHASGRVVQVGVH